MSDLFSDYAGSAAGFDELGDGAGVRPHWAPFVESMRELGRPELTARWDNAQRMIRQNGVTYNVYADEQGVGRPWPLDPIPLMISADEWDVIEAAVRQRARLMNAVLADVYGPQTLLERGLIPPELVFGHRGFLRPCHGLQVPQGKYLYLYAADLVRAHDGSLMIIKDRTQAPSGAGYALENRIVLTRSLQEVFERCGARRLAIFFRLLRNALASLAPRHRENPRIVLLTPGPYNESYFEHAYLSRYLGYTLVEGGDLTVRDNCVWLKTLSGLQPVDVILRRLDDSFCDPLELRGDSFLGVPGLVQAARAGNVAIANALGSGLAQTPALIPLLPRLSREFLGEDLLLGSVPTWWCRDEASCRYVEASLSRLVIKESHPTGRRTPAFGADLSAEQRARLIDQLRRHGERFVAQEQIEMSTTPVLVDGHLEARHAMLRVYAVAVDDGYEVMPGGMARVSRDRQSLMVSLQQGGGSKDVWVASSEDDEPLSLTPAPETPLETTRGGGDLSSRLADNLFWLGRYVERAEGMVRVLRAVVTRMIDHQDVAAMPEVIPLLGTYSGRPHAPIGWADLRDLVMEVAYGSSRSLRGTLVSVEKVAGRVRDRMSSDTWRVLLGLFDEVREPVERLTDLLNVTNHLVLSLAAYSGLAFENTTRGAGLRFLELGRRVERATYTVGLLRSIASPDPAAPDRPMSRLLEALLDVADSQMTYRQRYLTRLQVVPVVDLLMTDETNPRSLAFQIVRLDKNVARLPQPSNPARLPAEQRITVECLGLLRLARLEDVCAPGPSGSMELAAARPRLAALCDRVGALLPALSDVLAQAHLSHAPVPRHLAVSP